MSSGPALSARLLASAALTPRQHIRPSLETQPWASALPHESSLSSHLSSARQLISSPHPARAGTPVRAPPQLGPPALGSRAPRFALDSAYLLAPCLLARLAFSQPRPCLLGPSRAARSPAHASRVSRGLPASPTHASPARSPVLTCHLASCSISPQLLLPSCVTPLPPSVTHSGFSVFWSELLGFFRSLGHIPVMNG